MLKYLLSLLWVLERIGFGTDYAGRDEEEVMKPGEPKMKGYDE